MGKMMASGEAVPITALEGVTAPQAETLAEKGINDVEALAAASIDDLVDFLDVSFDEAERILASARSIVEAKNAEITGDGNVLPVDEEVVTETEAAPVISKTDESELPPVEGEESVSRVE
jgi:predicted RecB family nuclease